MLSQPHVDLCESSATAGPPPEAEPCELLYRRLAADENLFQPGDPRTHIFVVRSGVICVYGGKGADNQLAIEFAFTGDFVGLGFLDSHIFTARAMVPSCVECIPADRMREIVDDNPTVASKLADAIEYEFEARRDDLYQRGQERPLERVAALLLTVHYNNVEEGRPSDSIGDFWQCGTVADMLGLSVDELSEYLVELETRGIIAKSSSAGIRITDFERLTALADAQNEKRSGGMGRRATARPPALPPGSAHAA